MVGYWVECLVVMWGRSWAEMLVGLLAALKVGMMEQRKVAKKVVLWVGSLVIWMAENLADLKDN